MGFALLASIVFGQGLSTIDRSKSQIVPFFEVQNADVRVVLKDLLRQGIFGGTIAPDVQGTITLSLRNVPWDTALQNIVRQVDATYRIDHGFFEIVRRSEEPFAFPMATDDRSLPIESAYRIITGAVLTGKGGEIRQFLDKKFEARNATETRTGERGVRSFIDAFRTYPHFDIERIEWGGKSVISADVVVIYRRLGLPPIYFRDFWQKFPNDPWILSAREETSLNPPLRFVEAPLSVVLAKLFRTVGVSWTIDLSLNRKS